MRPRRPLRDCFRRGLTCSRGRWTHSRQAIVVDPGDDVESILGVLRDDGLKVRAPALAAPAHLQPRSHARSPARTLAARHARSQPPQTERATVRGCTTSRSHGSITRTGTLTTSSQRASSRPPFPTHASAFTVLTRYAGGSAAGCQENAFPDARFFVQCRSFGGTIARPWPRRLDCTSPSRCRPSTSCSVRIRLCLRDTRRPGPSHPSHSRADRVPQRAASRSRA